MGSSWGGVGGDNECNLCSKTKVNVSIMHVYVLNKLKPSQNVLIKII